MPSEIASRKWHYGKMMKPLLWDTNGGAQKGHWSLGENYPIRMRWLFSTTGATFWLGHTKPLRVVESWGSSVARKGKSGWAILLAGCAGFRRAGFRRVCQAFARFAGFRRVCRVSSGVPGFAGRAGFAEWISLAHALIFSWKKAFKSFKCLPHAERAWSHGTNGANPVTIVLN